LIPKMSQRKYAAEQYQLTEKGERGRMIATGIRFSAEPLYKNILRAVEKNLEQRPAVNGYEVVVYRAVGYCTPNPQQVFNYKVTY